MSMPSTGFYPFLHTITDAWDFGYICVNALNGLLSISTVYITRNGKQIQRVNALNGLLSISTGPRRSIH